MLMGVRFRMKSGHADRTANVRFWGLSGHFSQSAEGRVPPLPIEMNQEFGICRERHAGRCAFVIHCCAAAIWMMGRQALR